MNEITSTSLREQDLAHLWHPYTEMSGYRERQIIVAEGRGPYVFDIDGHQYVDAISGLWNVQVGHGQQEIIDAVTQQMQQLAFYPLNGRSHVPGIKLAAQLAKIAPGELQRVFFATGGAEAVETAIKMARQFWYQSGQPLRHKVIGLSRGWHGCTLGALAASGVAEEKEWYEPLAQGFVKIPLPRGNEFAECGLALEQAILQEGSNTVAAFLAEPIMGLAGMLPPPPKFWQQVQQIVRKYDILLIIDEVAMGFGRTGKWFASEHYNLEPDILTCAKGITSGYLPLAAALTTNRVYKAFLGEGHEFIHGYTFGGHPASCAAALANLEMMAREGLCERAARLGDELVEYLREELDDSPIVGEVRGVGLAIAIELVSDKVTRSPLQRAGELCNQLAQRGILVRPLGWNNVLPLIPHLNVPHDVVFEIVKQYCAVIKEAS